MFFSEDNQVFEWSFPLNWRFFYCSGRQADQGVGRLRRKVWEDDRRPQAGRLRRGLGHRQPPARLRFRRQDAENLGAQLGQSQGGVCGTGGRPLKGGGWLDVYGGGDRLWGNPRTWGLVHYEMNDNDTGRAYSGSIEVNISDSYIRRSHVWLTHHNYSDFADCFLPSVSG